MKRLSKLSLSRETLCQMDLQKDSTVINPVNDSCVQSCYLRSCEGGCTISMGQTD
jgi:hypothetical protein